MKVLFLLEYYEPHVGGVETLFKSLAVQLVKRGYQVTVLTNKYDSSLKSKEIIEGVEVIRYRFDNRYLTRGSYEIIVVIDRDKRFR